MAAAVVVTCAHGGVGGHQEERQEEQGARHGCHRVCKGVKASEQQKWRLEGPIWA